MDNLMGHGMTRYLGVSLRVFLEESSIWIGELSGAEVAPQCGWAPFNPLRAWKEQKRRGKLNSLSVWQLDLDAVFCLRWSGSQAFRLGLKSVPFSSLALRPSSYTSCFPGTPAYRWQRVGLVSFHNWERQHLTINLFLDRDRDTDRQTDR